ncbi:hypothetical protein L0222_27450 [bacterium]|nr:hypothetical protein [bacterium]
MRFLVRKAAFIGILLTLAIVVGCVLFRGQRVSGLDVASGKLKGDFESELRRRKIENKFQKYQQYVLEKVAVTRLIDKCRLSWIETLVREPLAASDRAEAFTWDLYAATSGDNSLSLILDHVAAKLDVSVSTPQQSQQQPQNPFTVLSQSIHNSRQAITKAFRSLSSSEQIELREKLYSQTTEQATSGHRFGGDDHGAKLIELLLRVDRSEILAAGRQLAILTDPALLERLEKASGSVPHEIKTEDGLIVIGGSGSDVYDLDLLLNVCAIVDLGGEDTYIEGTVTAERPVLVILDLHGDDSYRGVKPGIQGGAIMGASLIVDRSGNDRYSAIDVAQGSALSGVGLILDEKGDDSYQGDRRVQGQAINGFGMIIDHEGQDRYRGALLAQGVGGPLGFGLLVDQSGQDHYFAGGKYQDSYDDSPGFSGWSQGVGAGARDAANGGIGVLLDGGGDDVYEADYFSHGGGYWFGAGFARDFEGDDQRWGGVRTNFDGSLRTEPRFLRWGVGFGCHYAAGFVFDDYGNDTYEGDWASIAYAWDVALGALFDGDGNDSYLSRGSGVAEARNGAFAILYDVRGIDRYIGDGLGQADNDRGKSGQTARFSFALLQDRAGEDSFSRPLKNHTRAQRGWAGGFFIDR